MYHHFTGTLTHLDLTSAVVDCAGVGYKLTISGSTHREIASLLGGTVSLLAHLAVREDAMELYGFATNEELDAFRLLVSVSGVGPKAAVSILTALSPEGLAGAVVKGDTRAISSAQGVGAKTAARVVLELHDKFGAFAIGKGGAAGAAGTASPLGNSAALGDAIEALGALGYTRAESTAALRLVKTEGRESSDIIRDALRFLMKK